MFFEKFEKYQRKFSKIWPVYIRVFRLKYTLALAEQSVVDIDVFLNPTQEMVMTEKNKIPQQLQQQQGKFLFLKYNNSNKNC